MLPTGCRSVIMASAFLVSAVGGMARGEDAVSQYFGSAGQRIAFADVWRDLPAHPFKHAVHPTFHRLQTSVDALYSRCEQRVTLSADKPVRITIKLLAHAEVQRCLVRIGLKSETHGCWGFNIGTAPGTFGDESWSIIANAANPLAERAMPNGFDNRDWHTFVLIIPNAEGPAGLYCDGQYVMKLRTPITDLQRGRVLASAKGHGSIHELVPETAGDGDYVFIQSRLSGQNIDVGHVEVSQAPLATSRRSLPVLLDLDWELDGTVMVQNGMMPSAQNPLITKDDFPDPREQMAKSEITWPYVIRDDDKFRMYFCGPCGPPLGPNLKPRVAIFHAISPDGLHWEVTPKHPVLLPGEEGTADHGATSPPMVRKEDGVYRMWYGAYTTRIQQGRTAYAESKDGIRWVKPDLGLHDFAGRGSNVCFSLQPDPNCNEYELPRDIVRADEAAPERRYVLFLHSQGPRRFVIDVATSPDGIRFTRAAQNGRHYAFDDSPLPHMLHGAPFVLHEPHYWWAIVGHGELGKGPRTPRLAGWVVEPEDQQNVGFGLWRRMQKWSDSTGKDQRRLYHGRFLPVGNEWWVYYMTGTSFNLAKIGRHRILGLQLVPDRSTGWATSIGLRPPEGGWSAHRFTINVSGLAAGGRVQAELLNNTTNQPLPGFTLADSIPIEDDGYEKELGWTEPQSRLPDVAHPIRVRLKLTRGKATPQLHALYAR